MNRMALLLFLLAGLLAACGAGGTTEQVNELLVTDGDREVTYTVQQLKALAASEATFNDVTYVGVPLPVLLEAAGFDLDQIGQVEAVASDGYRMSYSPDLLRLENTLVAYARRDGPLANDEGTFRMVLPEQEGKLNVRMLSELLVVR